MSLSSRIAGKLIPDLVTRRVERAEAGVASQAARKLGRAVERDAATEIARVNAKAAQAAPALVAEKYRRMAESAHAFFRGAPQLYFDDLARADAGVFARGPKALLQGDLHLGNLGAVVRPDGKLAWGLVDVDEAAVGPVAAELRRMATSVRLTAAEAGLPAKQGDELVERFAKAYHEAMGDLAAGKGRVGDRTPGVVKDFVGEMGGKSEKAWIDELTRDGKLVRSEKALDVPGRTADEVAAAFDLYRQGLPAAERKQLAGYRVADVVAPVSGVSSLGRRRFRVLAEGEGKPLVFELKEQVAPALGAHVPQPAAGSEAARAKAAAEAFVDGHMPWMGATRMPGPALGDGSFLVRRMGPWHGAIEAGKLEGKALGQLVEAAGEVVARGHAAGAATGNATADAIFAALGGKKALAGELVQAGRDGAERATRDHAAFVKALAKDPLLGGRAIATR